MKRLMIEFNRTTETFDVIDPIEFKIYKSCKKAADAIIWGTSKHFTSSEK